MSLADELRIHKTMILTDLDAAHDYFHATRYSLRAIQQLAASGQSITIDNTVTGNITTEKDFPGKAHLYINENLAVSTLQQFVGLFEDFLFGLLRLWLQAHPLKLGRKQIQAAVVFEAATLDEVKAVIIDRELNELAYKRVREWFEYLDSLVHLGVPTTEHIGFLAEMKATRDIFIHNRGIANAIYEEKAGSNKRFSAGEPMTVPEAYHQSSWELIKKVVREVSDAAIDKA